MIERMKTILLIFLVAFSLIQSYLLAYSMPGLGVTVRGGEQSYVNAEKIGATAGVESVIFPEKLIIHRGDDLHTIIYPGTQFYEMILNQRIQGREFKGFQRYAVTVLNWDEIRANDIGIELLFEGGIHVELLQKLLKLEGDLLFLNETIDRIWIFKKNDTEEVRAFFFSSDGRMVYESVRADITVSDVQDYVGFGEYQPLYSISNDGLYLPLEPVQAMELSYSYDMYSPELMQRNLFFDPSTTRAIEDRSGSQIYTDGKRGLRVEQNGMWINYTDPAAPKISENRLSENVYAAVDFINQHGGWDGTHRLIDKGMTSSGMDIRFQQYIEQYPVVVAWPFRYGYMRLTMQQGVVTEFNRSLIELSEQSESRAVRYLPGGAQLVKALDNYSHRDEIVDLYPALKPMPMDDNEMRFIPVWGVRLKDGTESILMEAYPIGYIPPVNTTQAGNGQDEVPGIADTDSDSGNEAGNSASSSTARDDAADDDAKSEGQASDAGNGDSKAGQPEDEADEDSAEPERVIDADREKASEDEAVADDEIAEKAETAKSAEVQERITLDVARIEDLRTNH